MCVGAVGALRVACIGAVVGHSSCTAGQELLRGGEPFGACAEAAKTYMAIIGGVPVEQNARAHDRLQASGTHNSKRR